jgi:hypothetical protein
MSQKEWPTKNTLHIIIYYFYDDQISGYQLTSLYKLVLYFLYYFHSSAFIPVLFKIIFILLKF